MNWYEVATGIGEERGRTIGSTIPTPTSESSAWNEFHATFAGPSDHWSGARRVGGSSFCSGTVQRLLTGDDGIRRLNARSGFIAGCGVSKLASNQFGMAYTIQLTACGDRAGA